MKVEYVDHMGTDLSVVDAARASFDKKSSWECKDPHECVNDLGCGYCNLKQEDAKLISYLTKHNHWTPFAHTAITLRMQAPIPIRTQCFKHKAGFVENEESRRYISGAPGLFRPENFRKAPEGSVKQGSGEIHQDTDYFASRYEEMCTDAIKEYEDWIERGVCPEQARFLLPQGVLVNWVWTGNLASFARFYGLRTDPHAQKEVQDLAKMVGDIIEPLFPVSWKALTQ